MTKVEIEFSLERDPDEAMLARIADAHSIYGIMRVRIRPSTRLLTVEYDASRLKPSEVEAALERWGIPLTRKTGGSDH